MDDSRRHGDVASRAPAGAGAARRRPCWSLLFALLAASPLGAAAQTFYGPPYILHSLVWPAPPFPTIGGALAAWWPYYLAAYPGVAGFCGYWVTLNPNPNSPKAADYGVRGARCGGQSTISRTAYRHDPLKNMGAGGPSCD